MVTKDLYAQRFRITRAQAVRVKKLGGGYGTGFIKHPDYWVKVECVAFNCKNYIHGWITTLSMNPAQTPDELMMMRARYNYIVNSSGRAYDVKWDGFTVTFKFNAEQDCFVEHKRAIERDPVFIRNRNQLDYDQFFEEFNETHYQVGRIKQAG